MQEKIVVVSHMEDHEFEMTTMVVQQAFLYKSLIRIEQGDKKVNAKSIMGMSYLGLMDGDEVKIVCEGEDEVQALEAMAALLTNE